MSDTFELDITGLEELEKRMDEFGPELSRRALKKGVLTGAEVLKEAAKEYAPVLAKATPERRPGELRDAIDVVPDAQKVMAPSRESATVSATYNKADGQQSPGVWGKFVEYGSVNNRPEPFLRPALDEFAEAAIGTCIDVVSAELEAVPEAAAIAA